MREEDVPSPVVVYLVAGFVGMGTGGFIFLLGLFIYKVLTGGME